MWWNKLSKKIANRLWKCTKDNCVRTKSFKGELKKLATKSWFSVKKSVKRKGVTNKTRFVRKLVNSALSSKESIVYDNTTNEENELGLKARKIRLYPRGNERNKLKKWMGCRRFVYNCCVRYAIDNNYKSCTLSNLNKNIKTIAETNRWLADIPYDIVSVGIKDSIKNIASAKASLKAKEQEEKFRLKFHSKKEGRDSIEIRARDCYRKRGYYAFLSTIRKKEYLPSIEHSVRIVKNKMNEFAICIPVEDRIENSVCESENQAPVKRILSIDPGSRCFATGYDLKGYVYEWGCGDIERVYRLCLKIDDLISETTRCSKREKRSIDRVILRIRKKINNLINEFHNKFSKWLCLSYDIVLLPEFKVSGMIAKKNKRRVISRESVRKMVSWSHYRFKQVLQYKAKRYNITIIPVTEELTTKTCSSCGTTKKVGSSKTYDCNSCRSIYDRDFNASRNILIKYLSNRENNSFAESCSTRSSSREDVEAWLQI